ncbi:MAG: CRTAC1 family protein [Fimbriimonadaceae bacterium]
MLSLTLALIGQKPPTFLDKTVELGLTRSNTAACWVDLNNDGWTDLCSGGAVWMNLAGKKFERKAEVGTVIAADYDNDGYNDLFSISLLKLFHNNQGKDFTETALPTLPPTASRGAVWGDFNGDGRVDLYVGGFEDWDKQITYPSFVLTNKGDAKFELTWSDPRYRARGVTACDFDADGDLDLYVSNYRLQPNLLWINDGHGVFTDSAPSLNAVATSSGFDGGHSIGAAWGDFDNDGNFDLFAGNFAHVDSRGDQPKSRFYRSLGKAGSYKFEDRGTCGIQYQESYASPAAGDFDNDGRLDLFFTTVYETASFGKKNAPVLFKNFGSFDFRDVNGLVGLGDQGATYEAAWADFDRDGDLDLATNGKLFVNQTASSNWFEVRLEGDGKKLNRSAIGTQVKLKTKNLTLIRQVEAGTGEGNQNDLTLHFGLGQEPGPVDVEILWSASMKSSFKQIPANQIRTVKFKS